MAISDWPVSERPREKLLLKGAEALSDAELLAIFLRTGVSGKSAVDLARELLSRFNGLRALLEAVLELSRRHLFSQLQRDTALTSPGAASQYLTARLRHEPRELFACLYLDNRHRVLAFEVLFQGTIDGANVHPRVVVQAALKHNAAALILAHNHPSGVAEPSGADQAITKRLQSALELVEIRVLDHLIVGDGEVISLAERGLF